MLLNLSGDIANNLSSSGNGNFNGNTYDVSGASKSQIRAINKVNYDTYGKYIPSTTTKKSGAHLMVLFPRESYALLNLEDIGNGNVGNGNEGNYNTGNYNTGSYNCGDGNTGDGNGCDDGVTTVNGKVVSAAMQLVTATATAAAMLFAASY